MLAVGVEADTADENGVSGFLDESGTFREASVAPAETKGRLQK